MRRVGLARRILPLLLFLLDGGAIPAATPGPSVLLVLQEGLDAEELLGARGVLRELPGRAAFALMNTAVAGPKRPESAFLTIGAGTRCAAGGDTPPLSGDLPLSSPAAFFTAREATPEGPAVQVYRRRVGAVEGEAWLFCPGLPLLACESLSAAGSSPGSLRGPGLGAGALAETLRRHGRRVALLLVGHPPPEARLGALVAMDARGIVPRGAFVAPEALLAAVARFLTEANLLIVDLGRPNASSATSPRPLFGPHLRLVLPRLARSLDPERNLLLAVVPAPRPRDGAWDRLTAVIAWGRGVRPGALTSPTTRTPGLVANIDIAPTIAASLGLPTDAFMGRPISPAFASSSRTDSGVGCRRAPSPEALLDSGRRVTLHRHALLPVLGGAGLFAVVALMAIVIALAAPVLRGLVDLARYLLLVTAALPLALLIVPALGLRSVAAYAAATALVALATASGARVFTRLSSGGEARCPLPHGPPLERRATGSLSPLLFLYLLTASSLVIDLARGAPAIAGSLLSDFPLAGIRFYGIGNEYASVLVGTSVVGLLGVRDRVGLPRWLLAACFLLIVVLIGAPALGANFGGALTATAAFTLAWSAAAPRRAPAPGRWSGVAFRWARFLAAWLAVLALCAVLLFLLDLARAPDERTHVGRLADRMLRREPAEALVLLGEVAHRKLAMNLRLLTSGFTLATLVTVVPLLLVGYHKTGGRLRACFFGRPFLRAGVIGALGGGVVGLLVNDSGIVVWGLTTAAVLLALLDLLLAERARASDGPGRGGPPDRRGDE